MRASVVIRSRNEADRLRLTLESLRVQGEPAEVVVVNDGSSDHTAQVLAEARSTLDLVCVHHGEPAGRSGAANAGARRASGDILIFLDGDTLAAPDMVARHMDEHRRAAGLVVRGETWHLRCTRPLLDPEAGTPRAGEEAKVTRMSAAERARSVVTRRQIVADFDAIASRAQPGIYPGFGPRRLYELEMEALRTQPDCPVLWIAASGANQSLRRQSFLDSGGFHPGLTINEHRELALRLCMTGLRMTACAGRTFHMTHRSGWRNPLEDTAWEETFYAAHPTAEVALMALMWESLGDDVDLPEPARILSLSDLARAAAPLRGLVGLHSVRQAHLDRTRALASA